MFTKLWRAIFNNPHLFEYIRKIMNAQMMNKIKKFVQFKQESILDVGCGTGTYSPLAKGEYLGVDLNSRFIRFAKEKYGSEKRKFQVIDVTKMKPKKKFAVSFFLSMLHHFSDEDNLRILERLSKISKKVLIIDLVRPKNNIIKNWIVDLDRGDYVRPLSEQRRIITKYLTIEKQIIFNVLSARHSLFICTPKKK